MGGNASTDKASADANLPPITFDKDGKQLGRYSCNFLFFLFSPTWLGVHTKAVNFALHLWKLLLGTGVITSFLLHSGIFVEIP